MYKRSKYKPIWHKHPNKLNLHNPCLCMELAVSCILNSDVEWTAREGTFVKSGNMSGRICQGFAISFFLVCTFRQSMEAGFLCAVTNPIIASWSQQEPWHVSGICSVLPFYFAAGQCFSCLFTSLVMDGPTYFIKAFDWLCSLSLFNFFIRSRCVRVGVCLWMKVRDRVTKRNKDGWRRLRKCPWEEANVENKAKQKESVKQLENCKSISK